MNNLGQVAFVIEPTSGQRLLVAGPDPTRDRVVGSGDALLGRTVGNIAFGRKGLNDNGELVFVATFSDGSSAVVVAIPDNPPPAVR